MTYKAYNLGPGLSTPSDFVAFGHDEGNVTVKSGAQAFVTLHGGRTCTDRACEAHQCEPNETQ